MEGFTAGASKEVLSINSFYYHRLLVGNVAFTDMVYNRVYRNGFDQIQLLLYAIDYSYDHHHDSILYDQSKFNDSYYYSSAL